MCVYGCGALLAEDGTDNRRKRSCEGASDFYCVLVGACAGAVCVGAK